MRYLPAATVLPFVLAATAHAQWTQIWAEEFNQAALDAANWEMQIGTGTAYGLPAGWGNDELQYYTNLPANLQVSNGTLKIIAREQTFGGRSYTSARIRTLGKFEFQWGRVEARMKLPSTRGVWPALWMLPTDSPYGGWASSGEIDIMESVNFADRIYGTLHFGSAWPNNASTGGSFANGTDFSQNFHDYAVEWDPDQIRWYIDGQLYSTKNADQWFSASGSGNARAPFDHQFHLLLNIAVGGGFPGNPDGSSQWPQTLEVDYVRVFRREQAPFGGTPHAVPGQIESEDYDAGYPGEAYFDTDAGNNGSAYRTDDVDVQVCSEGGFNVGWLRNGEWLEYTVDVESAGDYLLEARVASQSTGGSFRIERDGQDLTGPVGVPVTGGWQNWQTVLASIQLEAGPQTLRFAKDGTTGEFNVNWLRLTPQSCPADLAEPFGSLNFFDVAAYLALYNSQDPAADLAEPFGALNFFDIASYLSLYYLGCP